MVDEEKLNSISHSIASLISVIGLILLIKKCDGHGLKLFCSIIYGFSLIILYTSSALYHGIKRQTIKRLFRILDHCSIFFLIAGTYTPILLISINGNTGWWFFGIQWTLAFIGIVFKIFFTGKYESLSVSIYLIMGWMITFKWNQLTYLISASSFYLLLIGGIIYTIGIFFYLFDSKIKYFHFVWHLLVITGSILHYIAIYKYVIS